MECCSVLKWPEYYHYLYYSNKSGEITISDSSGLGKGVHDISFETQQSGWHPDPFLCTQAQSLISSSGLHHLLYCRKPYFFDCFNNLKSM